MARTPSASVNGPNGSAGRRGGKVRPDDPTSPERVESGGMEDDPVVESSADPWAEADAGHPDESSLDSPDQHAQPEDETANNPST
jgi:hypothetical protein